MSTETNHSAGDTILGILISEHEIPEMRSKAHPRFMNDLSPDQILKAILLDQSFPILGIAWGR